MPGVDEYLNIQIMTKHAFATPSVMKISKSFSLRSAVFNNYFVTLGVNIPVHDICIVFQEVPAYMLGRAPVGSRT